MAPFFCLFFFFCYNKKFPFLPLFLFVFCSYCIVLWRQNAFGGSWGSLHSSPNQLITSMVELVPNIQVIIQAVLLIVDCNTFLNSTTCPCIMLLQLHYLEEAGNRILSLLASLKEKWFLNSQSYLGSGLAQACHFLFAQILPFWSTPQSKGGFLSGISAGITLQSP